MDEDLALLSRDELIAEVKRQRAGIREHRDSTGHELSWHRPKLWSLLPEKIDPEIAVPAWPQFLRGCVRYRESLDAQVPSAPRVCLNNSRSQCKAHVARFALHPFGQFWVMRYGKGRKTGTAGNEKSTSCILATRQTGSNLTLTARKIRAAFGAISCA
jgi:hypothetical protein